MITVTRAAYAASPAARFEDIRLLSLLGRGAHSAVHRGELEGRAVAVKLSLGAGEAAAWVRFRREAALLARLDGHGTPRLLESGETADGHAYLVEELIEGETLDSVIRRAPLGEARTTELGLALCDILAHVHALGAVHRDLKPENILLRPDGSPVLVDFGVAAEAGTLRREEAVGTFAYSAPEQTGMLARPIDRRADLYGLGAVLFHCLAGQPPFEADSPLALLQLHAAAEPPSLEERGVAAPLAAIVKRLLAKDPDDRFASAADLADALHASNGSGRRRTQRTARELSLRTAELAALSARLDAARQQSTFTLLTGPFGSGKSWLVTQLAELAQQRGVAVLRAHGAGQAERPFAVLAQLLEGLVARALTAADGDALRARLASAAGEFAPFLVRLAPGLAACLPAAQRTDVEGSREVYLAAALHLFRALARESPWLLAVEDVHASDDASLAVLERLAESADCALCVVCTALAGAGDAGAMTLLSAHGEELALGALSERDVALLIGEQLGAASGAAELAPQLTALSGGNPLAVREYLRALIDGGVVRYAAERWSFDASRLAALELPGDVGDLAASRLGTLPAETRRLLAMAVLFDSAFDLPMLVELAAKRGEEQAAGRVAEALAEAVHHGLVLFDASGRHSFSHDRVREALRGELDDVQRAATHRAIAGWLEHDDGAAAAQARLYLVAHHWFMGVDADCAAHALSTSREAACQALRLGAFDQAERFYAYAEQVAGQFGLPVSVDIHRGLAEARFERGEIDEALAMLEQAAQRCADPIDRADLHVYLAQAYFFRNGSTQELGRHLRLAHRALGRTAPREGPRLLFALLGQLALFVVGQLTGIGRGAWRKRREAPVLVRLHEYTGLYGMFADAPLTMLHSLITGYRAGFRLGDSREQACGEGAAGVAIASLSPVRPLAARFFARGYALARALGDRPALAVIEHYEAVAHCFANRPAEAERAMVACLERQASWLDSRALITLTVNLACHQLNRGHVRRAIAVLESQLMQAKRRHGARISDAAALRLLIPAYAIAGRPGQAAERIPDLLQGLEDPVDDCMRWVSNHAAVVWYLLETDELGAPMDEAIATLERSPYRPQHAPWVRAGAFVHVAQARHAQCLRARDEERPKRLAQLQQALVRARAAVKGHAILTPLLGVLDAACARLEGRPQEVLDLLAGAERLAHAVDSPWALYEAHLERARALTALAQPDAAERAAAAAEQLSRELDWPLRERAAAALRKSLAKGGSNPSSPRARPERDPALAVAAGTSARDRAALLKVGQALTGELEPRAQAAAALDTLLAILNAERACMFTVDERGELSLLSGRRSVGGELDAGETIAHSIVMRVWMERRPLVLSGTEEGAALGSQSVVAQSLRSIICAPLELRERTVGVVYVDSRLARGMFSEADLDVLVAIARQIAIAQELAQAAQREVAQRALERDLALAAAVQELIMPSQHEVELGTLAMASMYQPATHAGGDFWQWQRLPDDGLRIVVGDVTGHGADAAMITAYMGGVFEQRTRQGSASLDELVQALHAGLRAVCARRYAMSLSAVEISATGEGRWLNAGAPPLLVRRASGEVDAFSAAGSLLGSDELQLGSHAFRLDAGDSLVLFSDGVTELQMESGREFGLARLGRLLRRCAHPSDARAVRDVLRAGVLAAAGQRPLEDDMTLIVCTRSAARGP
jgi:serine phosphatase RsbU (regulator of sigma subunit)